MTDACPLCKNDHARSFEQALKIQAATPGRLSRLLRRLRPDQLTRHPAPGKWSISEVAWHLADCEIVYGFRYRKLLAEDAATLPAFDQNLWASATGYLDRDPRLALETFAALRKTNVGLAHAHADRRAQTGTHPDYGDLSLADLVVHLSAHDQNHLNQIRRLRKAVTRAKRR